MPCHIAERKRQKLLQLKLNRRKGSLWIRDKRADCREDSRSAGKAEHHGLVET
jgi:hypothetical protein